MNYSAFQDNALLELNLKSCKKYRPALHQLLSNTEETDRFSLVPPLGNAMVHNLVDEENEALFYELEDPIGSMAEHIETCINKLQGIMICMGFGLGYGPLMLVKQKNFVSRSIVILEPDAEVLLKAFRALDCREIIESKDVLMLIDMQEDQIGAACLDHLLKENRLIHAKNIQIVDLPSSVKANGEYFEKALSQITATIKEAVKLAGNCPDDSLQGLDCALTNLTHHIGLPGIEPLRNAFEGKPGVVVASGPSLDKNIELLKEIQNKAVLVAADASLRMMLPKEIKPHFVTSVERAAATSRLFDDLAAESYSESFLVGSPICHPDTFKNYLGPQISTEREHGFFSIFNLQKGVLSPGPSAGNLAFRLLSFLGCDPIILVGQDLSTTDEGKTHASGNLYGDQVEGYLNNPELLPGNYQETVRTNWVLKMFHQSYEYDVSNVSVRVINATEGGARIAGTEIKTLRETIDEHVTSDLLTSTQTDFTTVSDYIASCLEYPDAATQQKQLADVISRVKDTISYLDDVATTLNGSIDAAAEYADLLASQATNDGNAEAWCEAKLDLEREMNKISLLTADPQFRAAAMDMVGSVFFHTMIDYTQALANAESAEEQTSELCKNVENLANNFKVLLRYVRELWQGHLDILEPSLSTQ